MNEVRSILEQIRKMKTLVVIVLLIAFILFYYKALITEVVESKVKVDEVKKDINNNVLVQQMLNDLMLKYKADRAYIFRFHNSILYYDSHHRNHQSMAFEVCNNGISSEAANLQNLPVSLFPIFLQQILLDRLQYQCIDNIKETSTKIALKRQGIKSLYIAPFFLDGNFVAYIGLDFVKEEYQGDFDYHEFKSLTNEIGTILTTK